MGSGASTQTLTVEAHGAYPELISDGDNWLLLHSQDAVTVSTAQAISGVKTFTGTTTFGTVNASALQVAGIDIGSTYATLSTAQTISGTKTFAGTTTLGTMNATALQVAGVDIGSTYTTLATAQTISRPSRARRTSPR